MWLLRLAALAAAFLFLRWVWSWLWGARLGHARRKSSGAVPPARRGTLVRDPVCGTHVDAAFSLRETVNGQAVHFCSEHCRDSYRAQIQQQHEVQYPG